MLFLVQISTMMSQDVSDTLSLHVRITKFYMKFKILALYWLKIKAHINLVEAFKIQLLDKSVI